MRWLIFVLMLMLITTILLGHENYYKKVSDPFWSQGPHRAQKSVEISLKSPDDSPGLSIVQGQDNTHWDYQSNGGDERHVWVKPDGSVHAIYSGQTINNAKPARNSFYVYSEDFGKTFSLPVKVEIKPAEFPAMDIAPDGRPIVISHNAKDPRRLYLNIDFQKGMGFFIGADVPDDPPNYALARVAVPSDSIAVLTAYSRLGINSVWNAYNFKSGTFLHEQNQLAFPGVNGKYGYTHAVAKSNNGKVAMAMVNFLGWKDADFDRENDFGENGIVVRESTDGGFSFGDPVDVAQYGNEMNSPFRWVWLLGLSAIYVGEELHLTWVEQFLNDVHDYPPESLRIVHWSPGVNNGIPTIAARWDSLHFAYWEGDPHIAPLDFPYIGADENGVLTITFCSFPPDTTVKDTTTGYLYSDIFAVSSADNGLSWGEPTNLTNSPTMDDRYPYISEWNEAGKINVLYQTDTKTGSITQGSQYVGDVDFLFLKTDHPSTEPYNFYTDVESPEDLKPQDFSIFKNYPNPFNPSTTIEFECPVSSLVTLDIYNLLGRHVKTLVHEIRPAGRYAEMWHAKDNLEQSVSAGVYFAVLKTNTFQRSLKLALVK